MVSPVAERKARFRNGIESPVDPQRSWVRRFFGNPWLWACVVSVPVFAFLLWQMWLMNIPEAADPGDQALVNAMFTEAVNKSFWWALPTLVAWLLIFRFADRYRRVPFAMWFLALGWGIAVSTYVSIHVNSWAAEQMAVQGNGDPATAAGPAIFVAPFVEEFAKATILFALAIFARNRLVSRLQMVSLAGLSAAGFAFTENILYYTRGFLYATVTAETGPDAEASVLQLVLMRGFYTAFGHPLFTMMTAGGLIYGLRSKSRIVRVVAPLSGFLMASLLHMMFNGIATTAGEEQSVNLYLWVALPMVALTLVSMILASIQQGQLIRSRLTDFVRTGWLKEHDPVAIGQLRKRFKAQLASWLWGWSAIVATLKYQRRMTELAYLRDSMTRGLVDEHGADRAAELLREIRALRPVAMDDPQHTRLRWGWTGKKKKAEFSAPTAYPGPAGIGGNWPAPVTNAPHNKAPAAAFAPPTGAPVGR